MKRIKLHLTGCGTVLTKDAEKKLEKGEDYQVPRCSNGLTEEQYLDLGIPLPSELEAKIKNKDKGIELEDEDFEEVYSDVSVYESDILLMVSDEDATTIFLRDSDITLTVLETCDMIDDYINYQNRSWVGRIIDFLSVFFSREKK